MSKEKQAGGRYKKVYGREPRTLWERLVQSPDISEESKAELLWRRALYNPVELNRKLNGAVENLLKRSREKGCTENTPCQEGGTYTPSASAACLVSAMLNSHTVDPQCNRYFHPKRNG
ncbi:MAG: hypothetical protein LBO04_06340 [Spirochaetaceae bacterium]|nr:hypothetical protein [Spirochaetaceae bacterium]